MNNKNILIIALTGLAILSGNQIASAYDQDERNSDTSYRERDWDHDGRARLDSEINHVNRMVNHVERQMRRYNANRHIWREYQDVRSDVRRLNNQYHNGEQHTDRRRLRAQIEHIRNDLHSIERELHIRTSEWYQWR